MERENEGESKHALHSSSPPLKREEVRLIDYALLQSSKKKPSQQLQEKKRSAIGRINH